MIERAQEAIAENREDIAGGVLGDAFLLAGGLMPLVLAFFFMKDGPRMVDWMLDQVHGSVRRDGAEVGRRICGR